MFTIGSILFATFSKSVRLSEYWQVVILGIIVDMALAMVVAMARIHELERLAGI